MSEYCLPSCLYFIRLSVFLAALVLLLIWCLFVCFVFVYLFAVCLFLKTFTIEGLLLICCFWVVCSSVSIFEFVYSLFGFWFLFVSTFVSKCLLFVRNLVCCLFISCLSFILSVSLYCHLLFYCRCFCLWSSHYLSLNVYPKAIASTLSLKFTGLRNKWLKMRSQSLWPENILGKYSFCHDNLGSFTGRYQ